MFCNTCWLNNIPEKLHNFNKKDPSEAFHLDSEYDIGSVMHYGGYDFSKNWGVLPTIIDRRTGQAVRRQVCFICTFYRW